MTNGELPKKFGVERRVLFLIADTTDPREREVLLYCNWTEGSFVKVCSLFMKRNSSYLQPLVVVFP